MSIIRKAFASLFGMVKALDSSELHREYSGRDVRTMDDPDVLRGMQGVYKECTGNTCYQTMKTLLFYMKKNNTYGQGKSCNNLDYVKDSYDKDSKLTNPKCWRDQMLIKASYFFASILQGMMVVQFQRTSFTTSSASLD